jgi:Holliday junction resolvase RusA-like endonuclease
VGIASRMDGLGMPKAKRKPVDESWTGAQPLRLEGGAVPEPAPSRLGFVDKLPAGSLRTLINGLALPMPPSANAAWDYRSVFSPARGRVMSIKYTTNQYKQYTEEIAWRITEARARHWSENLLRMQVVCCFRDERKQDIDNRVKPLLDALKTAQLFKDDSQIVELEVRRGPKVDGGRVIVSCWEILPDRAAALTWVMRQA